MEIKAQFCRNIWNKWENMMVQPPQTHNHGKYDNSWKDWYFWFDYGNNLSYKYILSITFTHSGRVTHMCASKLTIIASGNNRLSPDRRQAIIWTNAGILLIGPSGTNFNEILIEIHTFSFKKMHLKMSSGNWRPFCLGFNMFNFSVPAEVVLQTLVKADLSSVNHRQVHPNQRTT